MAFLCDNAGTLNCYKLRTFVLLKMSGCLISIAFTASDWLISIHFDSYFRFTSRIGVPVSEGN